MGLCRFQEQHFALLVIERFPKRGATPKGKREMCLGGVRHYLYGASGKDLKTFKREEKGTHRPHQERTETPLISNFVEPGCVTQEKGTGGHEESSLVLSSTWLS